jgi:hypothetical protein
MNTQMPPGQLTTAELAREITALEAVARDLPADGGGRLEALYAERAERSQLAARHLRAAQQHFPDDAS